MRTRAGITLLMLSALLGMVACSSGSTTSTTTVPLPTSRAGLRITDISANGHIVSAEVADSEASRTLGLGGRDGLAPDAGMLFVFPQDGTPGFWMKDMRFALDFIWIDAGKRVAGVTANVQPQPGAADAALTLYHPPSPVRYVLEVDAGAAAQLGLAPGAQLTFALPGEATPAR